jgi:DNA-binding NarL/FixJ family response regulator
VTRVTRASDEALIRVGLRTILEAQPDIEVVGDVAGGVEVVEAVPRHPVDVVLMDIRMGRVSGLEATRRLAACGTPVPVRVLILTTFDLDEYVDEALAIGASGFLLESASPEELVAAVRAVAAGEAVLAPSIPPGPDAGRRARPRARPDGRPTAGPSTLSGDGCAAAAQPVQPRRRLSLQAQPGGAWAGAGRAAGARRSAGAGGRDDG